MFLLSRSIFRENYFCFQISWGHVHKNVANNVQKPILFFAQTLFGSLKIFERFFFFQKKFEGTKMRNVCVCRNHRRMKIWPLKFEYI